MSALPPGRDAADAGRLPLVFGVAGHRDLRPEDLPELEERVADIFDQFRADYPATPMVLLSPLAEGADRLVARVALERGIRLIAPLPMPRAMYETDFIDEASRLEFASLLREADGWFALPLQGGESAAREPGPARDRQYAAAGALVAQHSQILIALWDGIGGRAAHERALDQPRIGREAEPPVDAKRLGIYRAQVHRRAAAGREVLQVCGGRDRADPPPAGVGDGQHVAEQAEPRVGRRDPVPRRAHDRAVVLCAHQAQVIARSLLVVGDLAEQAADAELARPERLLEEPRDVARDTPVVRGRVDLDDRRVAIPEHDRSCLTRYEAPASNAPRG